MTNTNRVSFLLESPPHPAQLLKRRKRWLVYELGTSLTLTVNVAKSIVDITPSGLIWIAEYTLVYDLPAGTADWIPRRTHKPEPQLPSIPRTPALVKPRIVPYSPQNPIQPFFFAYPQKVPAPMHSRKSFAKVIQVQRGCSKLSLVRDKYGNYYCSRVAKKSRRLRRQLTEEGKVVINHQNNPHGLLFDVISLLSMAYSYQIRHCIMRTLCESRHLISLPGEFLFHDIFRILLHHVQPEIANQPSYIEAFTAGYSLHECSSLYGPHCRHSFLLELVQRFSPKRQKIK
ncbi:uncharacterized protein LOC115625408 [Scaptodrosophila lebanonensis]|uniref:Uncharacterized protein LOC115625408 n=1 Tax=Drosophila lebanonensis TaxID=7225 RepID=A0A6J2TMT5_DROLE|nr:uncharacterized protein LOC115625408 [Scaptodrosophila lebanonensis]